MKILIKESQYSLLLEQSNVTSAYNDIVDASSGPGTDPDKILKAFDKIKNIKDFTKLVSMFKDKKTGYDSFSDMINQEYEKFNFDDVLKLKQKLYPLGVVVLYSSGKNYLGEKMFTGNFTFRIPNPQNTKQNDKNCINKYNPLLVRGKKHWIDWLSNPITKQKFIKNWSDKDYDINDVNEIFKNYINSLNNLKLFFYDNSIDEINDITLGSDSRGFYAFVSEYSPNNIYINCSLNDDDAFGTLIHEIQHILYDIHPLNPDAKVGELFVDKNTNKMGPIDFLSKIINPIGSLLKTSKTSKTDNDLSQNIKNISKIYNIKFDELKDLYSFASRKEKEMPGYVCRETEKMSNITSIRNLFNIKPGQNITLKMLSPYIRGEKQHTDVTWLLSCWALTGFSDINTLINKMNQLAYQDFKSNKDNTRLA
jgi:hypothetical protein